MNGLLFHLVGPHHYAQMTGLLSGEEMRQGPVYLQCTDDDDSASLEGHICLKALEEELFLQPACLQTMLNSFPPLFFYCHLALEILLLFFTSVFI